MPMKKSILASLIVYPLLAIGAFCLFFFIRKNYALSGWIDPLFFAGAFVLGGGLLSLLARFGAFDTVVYGFRSIFKHMNPNYTNAQDPYPDYYAYSESKKEKRKQNKIFPWPWLVLGIGLIIASFIIRGIVF